MTHVVPPPAVNVWDVDAITAGALEVLRLAGDTIDAQRVRDLATTATGRVDDYVDRCEPIEATPAMITAAIDLTVELYRNVGAPTVTAWGNRLADPIEGTLTVARPDKQRWGVA